MRRRTSLSLSIALLLALAAIVAMLAGRFAMELSIVPDLNQLEEASARRDAERVQHMIEADLVAVDGTNQDYAPWSETIQFIQGMKPSYATENFDLGFFTGQRITHVVIFDNRQQMRVATSLQDGQLVPMAEKDVQQVAVDLAGIALPSSGVLELGTDRALLYSARPVQGTGRSSSPAGMIVMMRALDSDYAAKLSHALSLTIAVQPVPAGNVMPSRVWLEPDAAVAEAVMREPPARYDLLVTIRAPRSLSALIDSILRHTTIVVALTALLTGLTIWAITNFYLLRPIRRISTALRQLHGDQAPAVSSRISALLPVKRSDEVGEIAGEIVAMHHRIIDLAQRDPLTGCPNRSLFADRVAVAIAKARRSREPFLLLYVDLDKFKPINDGHGHAAGDAVLVETAQRLQQQVRGGDTVARIGGDEFAILLSDPQVVPNAANVIDRLARAMAEPIAFDGVELSIGASIGPAVYPVDGADLDALISVADQRMYVAKSRNRLAEPVV